MEKETDKDDSLMNHKTKQDKRKTKSIEIEIKVKVMVELLYINYTSSELTLQSILHTVL